jgi:protein TonB
MNIFNQNQWNNPTDTQRNELVFEFRNKEYGAYQIRREYNQTLIRALAMTSLFIIGLFLAPKISMLMAKDAPLDLVVDVGPVIFDPPIPDDSPIIENLQEKPIIPRSSISTKYFLEISDRDEDADTLSMDELNNLQVSSTGGTEPDDGNEDELFPDLSALGSGNSLVIDKKDDNNIYLDISIMPEYKGGIEALYKYFGLNVEFPEAAKRAEVSGLVSVGFVVEKDGSISGVKINGCDAPNYGFEEEAMRVVKSMPAWKPGVHNGHPARVQFSLPIKFKLY